MPVSEKKIFWKNRKIYIGLPGEVALELQKYPRYLS